MENNLKKVNLNKRPLTIVLAVICGILMLLLVVPWCQKHAVGNNIYYISPLAFTMSINIPIALIAFVVLIADMFLLMSDFFVIDSKHRVVIRIVSVSLLLACLLMTVLVIIGTNLPVNNQEHFMKKNIIKTLTFLSLTAATVGCSNPISFNNTSGGNGCISSNVISLPAFDVNDFQGVLQLRKAKDIKGQTFNYESEYNAFAKKMNAFSTKLSEVLIKQNYNQDQNFVMSPYSIELCLGLAIRCADGETRQEMLDAIGVDYDTFNRHYLAYFSRHYYEIKNYQDNPSTYSIPNNSIWIQDGVKLKETGLNALQDDYACDSFYADFFGKNLAANEAMKNYIYDKTNGFLAPNLGIQKDTMFVLMNIIYLKDIWPDGSEYAYRPLEEAYQFKNASGAISNKRLIGSGYFSGQTLEQEDYSAFYIETENHMRITFIKPNEGKFINDVFTKENIDYVLEDHYLYRNEEKKEKYMTCCVFPEFKAYSDIDLKSAFINDFHVVKLFGDCDFSNITDAKTFVSDFKHIAKIGVDTKGFEAAAVTYMTVPMMGHGDDYKTITGEFVLNKEFGYVISANDDVMFSGVVTNINQE